MATTSFNKLKMNPIVAQDLRDLYICNFNKLKLFIVVFNNNTYATTGFHLQSSKYSVLIYDLINQFVLFCRGPMLKPLVLSTGWNPPPPPGLIPQAAFIVNMTSNLPTLTLNIFCPCLLMPMLGTSRTTTLLPSQLIPITDSMD